MELKEYRKSARELTGKASEIARNLVLAGIGIIWIIRSDDINLTFNDPILLIPLTGFAIALFIDFMQYVIGGYIWMKFYRKKEAEGIAGDADIKSPPWRSEVLYWFYYVKIICMIVSFLFLIRALLSYY